MKINKLIRIISTLLLGCLFISQSLSAQSLNITWGLEQPYHKRGETNYVDIIHVNNQHIYYRVSSVLMFKENNFIVKHNRLSGENTYYDIQNSMKGYEPTLHSAELKDSDIHLSLGFRNKKSNKTESFLEVLDTTSMQAKTERVKLATVDRLPGKPNLHALTNINFEVVGNEFKYVVTNDKNDNTYSTIRTPNDLNPQKRYLNSEFSLVCYPKNKEKPIYLPLKLQENCFVTSCQLAVNEKQEIICAGLYSKKGIGTAAGCFSFVISNLLSDIKSVYFKEFTQDFLAKRLETIDFKYKYDKNEADKEFENNTMYKSPSIHFNKDGSYNIVFEKFRSDIKMSGVGVNMAAATTSMNYYYGDIFVINCNSDGSIKWTQKIPRFAYVIENLYVGNYLLKYDDNDNMFFMFNLIDTSPALKTIVKSNTVCVKLDKEGNNKSTVLESETEESKYIYPYFSFGIGSESFLVVKNAKKSLLPGTGASSDKITFGELKLK